MPASTAGIADASGNREERAGHDYDDTSTGPVGMHTRADPRPSGRRADGRRPECPRPAKGKVSAKVRERAAARRRTETVDVLVRFRSAPGRVSAAPERLGGHVRRQFRGSSRWMAADAARAAVAALAASPAVEFVASDEPVVARDGRRPAGGQRAWTGRAREPLERRGGHDRHARLRRGAAPRHPGPRRLRRLRGEPEPDARLRHAGGSRSRRGGERRPERPRHARRRHPGRQRQRLPRAAAWPARPRGEPRLRCACSTRPGAGRTSDVLAALQWVLANKDALGIRVLNLSLGHPIYEPAAARPAGPGGRRALGRAGSWSCARRGTSAASGDGTITSPCNSRKVISVGARNDRKTPGHRDDSLATYSSRGPTPVDHVAKPDLARARATGSSRSARPAPPSTCWPRSVAWPATPPSRRRPITSRCRGPAWPRPWSRRRPR